METPGFRQRLRIPLFDGRNVIRSGASSLKRFVWLALKKCTFASLQLLSCSLIALGTWKHSTILLHVRVYLSCCNLYVSNVTVQWLSFSSTNIFYQHWDGHILSETTPWVPARSSRGLKFVWWHIRILKRMCYMSAEYAAILLRKLYFH